MPANSFCLSNKCQGTREAVGISQTSGKFSAVVCPGPGVEWTADGKSCPPDRLPALWSVPLPNTVLFCTVSILLLFGERTMFGRNEVSDKTLLQTINRRLDRTGTGSQARLSAFVQRGTVTLSGTLQYENQRVPIVKAVSSIAGVHHVIDQLRMGAKRTF